MEALNGDTEYSIMFGPDICGFSTKKVHTILTHGGENHLIQKEIECKTDDVTHVYTLVISPDNTYEARPALPVLSVCAWPSQAFAIVGPPALVADTDCECRC